MRGELLDIIRKSAGEIDGELVGQIDKKGMGADLLSRGGSFDSLDLVELLVIVEQAIEDEYGVSITIANDKALAQEHSPFETVGGMVEYTEQLIRDAQCAKLQ